MSTNFGMPNQVKLPSSGNSDNNKPQGKKNFAEVVKDGKSSTPTTAETPQDQVKAATAGVLSEAAGQIFGGPAREDTLISPTQQPASFKEYLAKREKKIRFQERKTAEQQRATERVVYSKKEQETKLEIASLQQEIKKLAVATKELSAEVVEAEKTAFSAVVSPGTYHLNFFDRIRRLISAARKRINESKNWLSLFNSRKKQRSIYWQHAKKLGSKYTMSAERYMSMSAG